MSRHQHHHRHQPVRDINGLTIAAILAALFIVGAILIIYGLSQPP